MDGKSVLDIPTLSYDFQSEPSRMIRSNSPELWTQEGIAYDDQFSGNIRFLFHNKNTLGYNVRMYLVVTNEGNMPANFSVGAVGTGGPDPSEIRTGKLSTVRYLGALQANAPQVTTQVRPGQSVKVLPQISESAIKPGMVYSAYADVTADQTLRFRVVVVADGKDPLGNLDSMNLMPADGTHTRGSFNNTTRDIQIDGVLGTKEERVVLGDNVLDPYLDGYDNTDGSLQLNKGNFGVLYKMKVTLAPRTIVSLNPRGGLYAGAFPRQRPARFRDEQRSAQGLERGCRHLPLRRFAGNGGSGLYDPFRQQPADHDAVPAYAGIEELSPCSNTATFFRECGFFCGFFQETALQ